MTEAMTLRAPIPMVLYCPQCHLQHIDELDEDAIAKYDPLDVGVSVPWTNPPHRSHLCHGCGCVWRPADVATEGVRVLKTAGVDDTWWRDGTALATLSRPSNAYAMIVEALERLKQDISIARPIADAMTLRAREVAGYLTGLASVYRAFPNAEVWGRPEEAASAARLTDEAADILRALSRPPVDREAVARIIAPDAWGEMGHDDYLRRADEWSAKGRCDDDCLVGGYRQKAKDMVAASLAKADAILALIAGEGK